MANEVREPLTKARVVAAAVKLIDERGLDGFSMRKLGAELGVEAMSIYHHVPNKAELLAAVVDAVLAELPPSPPRELPWAERARRVAYDLRAVALRHPALAGLLAEQAPSSLEVLDHYEAGLEIGLDAGFAPADAFLAYNAVVGYVLGFCAGETNSARVRAERGNAPPPVLTQVMASADRFPRLLQFAQWLTEVEPTRQFEFGLEALLTGLQARLESQTTTSDASV